MTFGRTKNKALKHKRFFAHKNDVESIASSDRQRVEIRQGLCDVPRPMLILESKATTFSLILSHNCSRPTSRIKVSVASSGCFYGTELTE